MTIDTTYFYGPLSIAQLSQAAVRSTVQAFINEYEAQLLHQLLGPELYLAYKSGITGAVQKYIDIRDGKEYTNKAGQQVKWCGLAFTEGTAPYETKLSLIANYVYFHYRADNATQTTGTGEKNAEAKNATEASPRRKMVKAWNQMVEWNEQLVEFLIANDTIYPEFLSYYSDYKGHCKVNNLLTKLNPLF